MRTRFETEAQGNTAVVFGWVIVDIGKLLKSPVNIKEANKPCFKVLDPAHVCFRLINYA